MFKIETNVPMPVGSTSSHARKYPFGEMKVGDSLMVPCSQERRQKTQNSVIGSAMRFKPMKFITRQIEDGVRIWRIA